MGEHPDASLEPPEPSTPVTPDTSAAAVALALSRKRGGARTDARLDEFLEKQTRMLDLQMEHLHEQRALQEKHLRLRYFGDRLRVGLQLLGIAFGLVLALVIGAAAWSAYQDHGVVIEAFSVPPDLAARGLTGQVAASQLLDRLAELQAQTVTSRPASTYANDWGGDIKVEIPETGVSIGELNRYLRQWLGSETKIGGEIVRTPTGLAVTARAGDAPGRRFAGAEADVDGLIAQAAEAVYRQTQPYRYAVYLSSRGRGDEAIAAFARLARSGPVEDRAWAYVGWGSIEFQRSQFAEAVKHVQAALALNPRLQPAFPILGLSLSAMGSSGPVIDTTHQELKLLQSGRAIGLPGGAAAAAGRIRLLEAIDASAAGDYSRAAALALSVPEISFEGAAQGFHPDMFAATALMKLHDVARARQVRTSPTTVSPYQVFSLRTNELTALDDWPGLARLLETANAEQRALLASSPYALAQVYAHVGRLTEAEALVSNTPFDCQPCLSVRGLIASQRRDWAAADRWYGLAAGVAGPFSDPLIDWAQSLLARNDPDGAIARLAQAHRMTPKFADPLELWGEALMRKGDFAGAIGKFAEADKTAPRWGRNHLRWGEALLRSGRYAEARAQFEAAGGMDLSRPDRAALDVFLDRTAKGPLHG
jgi:tetratricopeptide (TPR) repeat protein